MSNDFHSKKFTQKKWKHKSKDLNINIHSTFIYNTLKLETIQWSINRWMNKLWYRHVMEYYTAVKMEWTTDTKIKTLCWHKKLQTKWIHLYETQKPTNLYDQKADPWWPGSEEGLRELLRKVTTGIFVVWKFLDIDCGGEDWHVYVCQNLWNTCLRWVHFMYVNPISKLIKNATENYYPTASV